MNAIKAKLNYWKSYLKFVAEFVAFRDRTLKAGREFIPLWKNRQPLFNYKTPDTKVDRHYVFHTSWASRVLAKTLPKEHVDIGSTLNFIGVVSAFIPIKFYDYRPATMRISNLVCGREDLLELSFPDNSIHSLSCMHTLEHVGLGRYGDTIDPNGDLRAMKELSRVLAHGGNLLIVVPIGKPLILFNKHRIYSYEQIVNYFKELSLAEFALIPDSDKDGDLLIGAPKEMADKQTYGCGCFWFKKK